MVQHLVCLLLMQPLMLSYLSDELLVENHPGEDKNLIFPFNYHSTSVHLP